jgi:uncharacterized protein YjbJ (UPF0337 family)
MATNERAKGKGNQAVGAVKEKIGSATGNEKLEGEGAGQKMEGKAQDTIGRAKDKVKEIADKVT